MLLTCFISLESLFLQFSKTQPTVITVKDTQQLEKWKERYPDAKIITD